MKNLLLLGILFCLSWPPLQAQTQQEVSLNGCITDTHLLPIDYATIVLQKEGHQITGAITDSEGCFTLFAEAGDYTLIIQCLGYDSIHTRVSIPTSTPLAYQLKPAAFAIKEVVVKANSIEREADRFIMTVQPMSGKDGTELLLDAPGVWLTEDNISINGSSGTKVYVNEREIKLSGEELIVYLRTLKAENIRRIEVIPIAGAEYEAGTRSGVVKITLRQQQIDGYQGTLSAGAIFGKHFQRYQPTGSLQLRMQKWVINASGSGTFTPNDKGYTDSERSYYQPGQAFADQTQSNTKSRYGTGRLGVIFEADSLNSFGGEIEYINRHTNEHSLNQTQFMIAEQTLLSDADNRLRNQNSTLSATANYVRKTDDLGSVLKAIVDYHTK